MNIKKFESYNREVIIDDIQYLFITMIADEWGLKEVSYYELVENEEQIKDGMDIENCYSFEVEWLKDFDNTSTLGKGTIYIYLIKKTTHRIEGKEEEIIINKFIDKLENMGCKIHKHIYQYLKDGKKLRDYLWTRLVITSK